MTKTIEKALRPLVKEYVNNAANEPDKKKKEMLDKPLEDCGAATLGDFGCFHTSRRSLSMILFFVRMRGAGEL